MFSTVNSARIVKFIIVYWARPNNNYNTMFYLPTFPQLIYAWDFSFFLLPGFSKSLRQFPNIAEDFRRCSDDFQMLEKMCKDVLTVLKHCWRCQTISEDCKRYPKDWNKTFNVIYWRLTIFKQFFLTAEFESKITPAFPFNMAAKK